MSNYIEMNNNVQLIGTISSLPKLDHNIYNEAIYKITLKTKRDSGNYDNIPICISERLIDITSLIVGTKIKIIGRYSSYNLKTESKSTLILYVFANEIEFVNNEAADKNVITINGSICKAPIYRKTPLGREISDVLIATNRLYGKSDYIPCICWGRNAKYISRFEIGSIVHMTGRIQSREYIKDDEKKTAYEVSICQIINDDSKVS